MQACVILAVRRRVIEASSVHLSSPSVSPVLLCMQVCVDHLNNDQRTLVGT
jgi:hypothetical protein